MKQADQHIPAQVTGEQTDFSHAISFADVKAAHEAFVKAAERLVDVNNWHQYAGKMSAVFRLTNEDGAHIPGWATEGLNVSIDLPNPTPGSSAGDGLEWVKVEKMETFGDADSAEEFILMTVRPVPDPRNGEGVVAHFYSDASTNTFIVNRTGYKVTTEAHGRNESPNNEGVNLHDKVRNTAVGLAARVGLSGTQWKTLVVGLLEYDKVTE